MKFIFNYDVLHLRSKNGIRRKFNKIVLFFHWTYFKQIKLEIFLPYWKYFKNPVEKSSKFASELLRGSHRKKNKLTFTTIFRFFNLQFTYFKIRIVKKSEYRKILKREGLLK